MKTCAAFVVAGAWPLLNLGSVVASIGGEESWRYDRDFLHFSPEGRLYQVQYAERAAMKGSPAVALSNQRDSIALCVERRRVSPLEDFVAAEKICELQEGMYMSFSGLSADGRRLVDKSRVFCENHRYRLAELPSVKDLAMHIAELQHRNTFVRAQRPYGVSCLIAGVDTDGTPRVYATEPSGVAQEWVATCIGEQAEALSARLSQHMEELKGLTAPGLAKLAAKLIMDARGHDCELEVVIVRRRGKGAASKVEACTVLVKGRDGIEALADSIWQNEQGSGDS